MNIVYYDYGGSHSSILSGLLHAGRLDPNLIPDGDELLQLPYFDKTTPEDFGCLHHLGEDSTGNQVFALGTRYAQSGPSLQGISELMGLSEDFFFVDTMPYVTTLLRIGGWLSRSANLPQLGRPLVVAGARDAYPALASLVEQVKLQMI